jgi:hypothetical protein
LVSGRGRGRGHVVETALCPSGKRLSRPTDSRQTDTDRRADGILDETPPSTTMAQFHHHCHHCHHHHHRHHPSSSYLATQHSTAQHTSALPWRAKVCIPTGGLFIPNVSTPRLSRPSLCCPHASEFTNLAPGHEGSSACPATAEPVGPTPHLTSHIFPPLPVATPCKLPHSPPPSRQEGSRLLYSVHAGLRRVVCAVVRAWRLGSWGRYPRRQDRV